MLENNHTKRLIIFLTAAVVLTASAIGAYFIWEKPPAVAPEPTAQPMIHSVEETAPPSAAPTEEPIPAEPLSTQRQDGVYTMLVAGVDDGGGNTDTIMVGKLDTVKHTLDVVSIPRDTLINANWWVKKINSAYAAAGGGEEGIASLRENVRRLLGFDVDCYAIVDLELFVQVVDAMGGVDYDVPIAMDYDIGPVIHLQPGYQHLNGEQALGLVRFRSAYVMGDLGRLEAQHDFLKAVAEQLIDLGNVPNLSKVLKLFETGLKTDLKTANIAYLVRQALMCKSDDINFYTMPNCPVTLNEYSYVTVEIMDWLDMINAYLNPFDEPVGFGNVDIVYRDWDGSFHGTAGLRDPSYFPSPYDEEESGDADVSFDTDKPEGSDTPEPSDPPESGESPLPSESPDVTPAPKPVTPEPPESGGDSTQLG